MFNIPRIGLSAPSCVWMTSRRSQGRELNTPAELPLDTMTSQASRSRAAPSLRISKTQWVVLSFWIATQLYDFDITIYLRNKQAHHQQPSLYSCQEEHHGTGLGEATSTVSAGSPQDTETSCLYTGPSCSLSQRHEAVSHTGGSPVWSRKKWFNL